jgi:hypothetical protein
VALAHLQHLLRRGLDATAALWPDLRVAHGWVQQVAHILANHEAQDGATVRARLDAYVVTMQAEQARAGTLRAAVPTFVKVTAHYGAGLFRCYDVPDLPRTNGELERCFGAVRYHARRTTGRRTVTGGVVIRGAVRVVAVLAAARGVCPDDLRLRDRAAWHALRRQAAWHALRRHLAYRRETRCAHRRFRRNPTAYLAHLEQHLLADPLSS